MKRTPRALLVMLGACAWSPLVWAQDKAPLWCGAEGCNGTFFIVLLFGALGGLVLELTLHAGNLEWPHRRQKEEDERDPLTGVRAVRRFLYDLGAVARIVVGALAAVAVQWVITDATGTKLIGLSLIAGFAGQSVFETLKDRLLAALKQQTIDQQANLGTQIKKLAETAAGGPREDGGGVRSVVENPTAAAAALQAAWSLADVIESYGSK